MTTSINNSTRIRHTASPVLAMNATRAQPLDQAGVYAQPSGKSGFVRGFEKPDHGYDVNVNKNVFGESSSL